MDKRHIIKTTSGLFLVLAFSRLMGFFREMLIAYRFGSGVETDAFFVAIGIQSVIYSLFASGLSVAIVPVVSDIRQKKDLSDADSYVSGLLNLFFILSLAMIAFGFAFTKEIVKVFALGFEGEQLKIAVSITRIGLSVITFQAISAILMAYNHCLGKFVLPSLESIFFNLPILAYLAVFYGNWGIQGLMVSFVVGYILRVLVAYGSLSGHWRYSSVMTGQGDNFRKTFKIMGPILIGSMAGQINHIVDKTLASRLVAGSISALTYAGRTKQIVSSLFLASLVTVVYPKISDYLAWDEKKKLQATMTYSINLILLIVIPALTGLIILNRSIIQTLFFRGAFTERNVFMTSSALVFYSIGLAGSGMSLLVNKVYFAMNDSFTPMKMGFLTVALNIILNLLLVGPMGHNGLALATSIAGTFSATLLFWGLRKKKISVEYRRISKVFLKATFSSIIMGVVVFLLSNNFVEIAKGEASWQFVKLIAVCGIGAIVYGLLLYIFKVEEVREIVDKSMTFILTVIRRK